MLFFRLMILFSFNYSIKRSCGIRRRALCMLTRTRSITRFQQECTRETEYINAMMATAAEEISENTETPVSFKSARKNQDRPLKQSLIYLQCCEYQGRDRCVMAAQRSKIPTPHSISFNWTFNTISPYHRQSTSYLYSSPDLLSAPDQR